MAYKKTRKKTRKKISRQGPAIKRKKYRASSAEKSLAMVNEMFLNPGKWKKINFHPKTGKKLGNHAYMDMHGKVMNIWK